MCRSSVTHWVWVVAQTAFKIWPIALHCTWCLHDVLPYTVLTAPLCNSWSCTEMRCVQMKMCKMNVSLCTTLSRRSFTPLTRHLHHAFPNLTSTRLTCSPPHFVVRLWHGKFITLSVVPRSMAGPWHSLKMPSPMPPTHYNYSHITFGINKYNTTWRIFMHWQITWTVTPTRCCKSCFSFPHTRWMSSCGC